MDIRGRWDLLDVLLAVGLLGWGLLLLGPHLAGWPVIALVGAGAAVAGRRHWPGLGLLTAVVVVLAQVALHTPHWVGTSALTATTYTLATRVSRRTGLVAGAGTLVVVGVGSALLNSSPLLELTTVVAALMAGDATRTRRAYVTAVEERARLAECDRDREARRQVAEERVRIARDLHDVVSHQLALIHVHAGVATHLLARQPDQAETALGHVRAASQAALDELAVTVEMLRRPDEPLAGLSRLAEVITALETSGLRVEQTVLGTPRNTPAVVDAAAYRIIQEALTNVRKHARTDTARLCLHYRPDELRITVDDDGTGDPGANGHGISGMLERASALGGRASAGPRPDGGFRVEAVLPSR